jgi:putative ATP-dependent endonuclease of the OLD family
LLDNAGEDKIHFNIPKLEAVLNYGSTDKDSLKIWNKIQTINPPYSVNFFPKILEEFLEFKNIIKVENDSEIQNEDERDDLPF